VTYRTTVVFALRLISVDYARSQPTPLEFVSVRIEAHSTGNLAPIGLHPGGVLTASGPLRMWVKEANSITVGNVDFRLLEGAPEWLGREYYDVEAIVPPTALPPDLPMLELRERVRELQRNMLSDRLKLRTHFEKREMDVYELRVAPGGIRLQVALQEKECPAAAAVDPNDATVFCHSFEGGRGRGMLARAATMADLAPFVEIWTDKHVVDKTGLTDLFRIDTSPWYGITARPRAPTALQDGVDVRALPTLSEVLARMGLELVPSKNTVDVLVIDHVEQPLTN
jgi:uncharacterized protein (TIGR03435 family)